MPAFCFIAYVQVYHQLQMPVLTVSATATNRWAIKGGANEPFLQNGNRAVMQKEGSGEGRHYFRKNNHSDDHMFLLNDEFKALNKLK